jgi:hypothetical protein
MTTKNKAKILYLKFGAWKGYDGEMSAEISELHDKLQSFEDIDEQKEKEILCEIIEKHDGKIWNWWDNKYISKKEAKKYVLNYGKENM